MQGQRQHPPPPPAPPTRWCALPWPAGKPHTPAPTATTGANSIVLAWGPAQDPEGVVYSVQLVGPEGGSSQTASSGELAHGTTAHTFTALAAGKYTATLSAVVKNGGTAGFAAPDQTLAALVVGAPGPAQFAAPPANEPSGNLRLVWTPAANDPDADTTQ